jgi:hypothetical protein
MNTNVFPKDIYFDTQRVDQISGLTKRELFAAMAMQGLLAADREVTWEPHIIASYSIQCADALFKALREKGNEA